MVEHTPTTADEPGQPEAAPVPRTSFEELAAEPERVAGEAAVRPVRIDGPNGEALVLVDAAAFERLTDPGPRARYAHEWTARERAMLRAQPIPDEAAAFDDEGGFIGHG